MFSYKYLVPLKKLHTYSRSITGGEVIYKGLLRNKVDKVFMYSGGAIMPCVDAFYKGPIKYYVNNHEQNCGHAATGYAKSSNKTGVFMVTSGPGITNSITPLLDATNDSTPLIAFSGNVGLDAIGTNAFQEAPAVEITKPVTKWSYCVKDYNELSDVVDEAFKVANHRKKGSVHIDLPKCVISKTSSKTTQSFIPEYNYCTNYVQSIDIDKLDEVVTLISRAKKPILYVGKGCLEYAKELTQFAEKANIPVTTTLHAMGIIDENHRLSLKMCGMHGSAYSNYAIQEADCILAIGSRFDDRTTGNLKFYAPKARDKGIVHVNIDSNEINNIVESSYNFNNDCGAFLKAILPKVSYKKRLGWFKQIDTWKQTQPFQYNTPENDKINTQQVLEEVNNHVSKRDDIICSTGVGNHQMMSCQFINWRFPKQILSSGSLGVMGVSLPYAIGAKLANPDKCVISIDGDSSFMMTFGDLKTVKEHNIPIKIIICNNGCQDMVRVWESLFFDNRITATTNKCNPSFVQLAKAFSIPSLYCKHKSNLERTIKIMMYHQGPIICEIKTVPDLCLPLVPPGNALDDMILLNNDTIQLEGEAPC